MKIVQLIKRLNNSELGRNGVHENYVQVPRGWDVSSIFQIENDSISFKDKTTNRIYGPAKGQGIRLVHVANGEYRICGLGPYYSDKNLKAGDEILFEKRQYTDERIEYYISCRKLQNTIILQKNNNEFEVLTPERMTLLNDNVVEANSQQKLSITFIEARPKRRNAHEVTNFYNIFVGENVLPEQYTTHEIIEVEIKNRTAVIRQDFIWKSYSFVQEG